MKNITCHTQQDDEVHKSQTTSIKGIFLQIHTFVYSHRKHGKPLKGGIKKFKNMSKNMIKIKPNWKFSILWV